MSLLNNMKLFCSIENEKGKLKSMGGNEWLDIDIAVGNHAMTSLTLRRSDQLEDGSGSGWGLFDSDDNLITWLLDEDMEPNKAKATGKIDCGCRPNEFVCRQHSTK